MAEQTLSHRIALRIGLAVKSLPDSDLQGFVKILIDAIGLPLSVEKLSELTAKELKSAGKEEFKHIDNVKLKQIVAILHGENDIELDDVPIPKHYMEGDLPKSVRVACASNSGERLNGHFGSCQRFLIYQVSATKKRLIDVRPTKCVDLKEDKNAYRAKLIHDCDLVYVNSVGGPAVAKIIKVGIFPIKQPQEIETQELLTQLQERLAGTPPPWLEKVMENQEKSELDLSSS